MISVYIFDLRMRLNQKMYECESVPYRFEHFLRSKVDLRVRRAKEKYTYSQDNYPSRQHGYFKHTIQGNNIYF